jgi:hypothetical protein
MFKLPAKRDKFLYLVKLVRRYDMKKILIEVESGDRANELLAMLSSLSFVKSISAVNNTKALIAALKEHEDIKYSIVSKKNKAIAKYL